MKKFELTLEFNVTIPVKVIVEAENREAALDLAGEIAPGSSYDAYETRNGGWGASVTLRPPKGREIVKKDNIRASFITQSSGGEKVREVKS